MTDQTPTPHVSSDGSSAGSAGSTNKLLLAGIFVLGVFVGAGLMVAFGGSETPENEPVAVETRITTTTGSTTTTSTTSATIPPTTTTTVGDVGSRENPVPLRTTAMIGTDWEASVIEVVFDANETVANENQFNDPPPEGTQFVLVGLSLTYLGAESAIPWVELSWQYLGLSNVASDEDCGVIPDQMFDVPEIFSRGTVAGNLCQVVMSEDVGPDLLLILEESFTFDETRVFFSLTD